MYEVTCTIVEAEIKDLMKTGSIAAFPNEGIYNQPLILCSFVAADSPEIAEKRFRYVFGNIVKTKEVKSNRLSPNGVTSKDWLVQPLYNLAMEGKIYARIEFNL